MPLKMNILKLYHLPVRPSIHPVSFLPGLLLYHARKDSCSLMHSIIYKLPCTFVKNVKPSVISTIGKSYLYTHACVRTLTIEE